MPKWPDHDSASRKPFFGLNRDNIRIKQALLSFVTQNVKKIKNI